MASAKKSNEKVKFSGKIDITFLSLILIIQTVGLVMLFSASYAYSLEYYGNSYRFIIRQALFALGGILLMLGVSRVDYHFWRKFAWIVFAISTASALNRAA